MQERLPPAPPARQLPGRQQLPDISTVPRLMGVERRQRRQLPVDRRGGHLRGGRRQHRHQPGPARWRQRQPGHVLAEILQPGLPPVQAPPAQEGEKVLQVMGVSLDRVRRPPDGRQVGQIPLDRLDRDVVIPQDRPRLRPRGRHRHSLNMHCFLHLIHVMDKGGDNHVQHLDPSHSRSRGGRGGQPPQGFR